MKKVLFLFLCFLINISIIDASSGALKKKSLIECDGVMYGYHAKDKHFHKAILKNGIYYADGEPIEKIPCANDTIATDIKKEIKFSNCIDGDTAIFTLDGKFITVRFLAIDTPETKHPSKGREPYGKEASNFTCKMLKNANKIEIEFDKNSDEKDKYERYLGWIFVDDSLLQKLIVKNGLAEVASLYGDYKYTDQLLKVENEAKTNKLGIWSNKNPDQNIIDIIISLIKKIFD